MNFPFPLETLLETLSLTLFLIDISNGENNLFFSIFTGYMPVTLLEKNLFIYIFKVTWLLL